MANIEQDLRLDILNTLLTTPHRDFAAIHPLHRDMAEKDPRFYVRLAAWYSDHGEVRDHKEMFVVHLALSEFPGHRDVGLALLRQLPPYQVARVPQLYGANEVGVRKVEALRSRLFRAAGIEIDVIAKELDGRNARTLLKGAGLVIDTFDNAAGRRLVQDACRALGLACLHVGLFADYAEIIWDEDYRVPADTAADLCDYPLARNLVLLAVAVASEIVIRFAADGERSNWSLTLRDFTIRPLERTLAPGAILS